MKLVYIASPLSGLNEETAFKMAIEASVKIKEAGFVPVSPILMFDGVFDEETERENVLKSGLEVLGKCDYIYVNKENGYWEESAGIKRELEFAKSKGVFEIEWQESLLIRKFLKVKR